MRGCDIPPGRRKWIVGFKNIRIRKLLGSVESEFSRYGFNIDSKYEVHKPDRLISLILLSFAIETPQEYCTTENAIEIFLLFTVGEQAIE
jgi:hypothetical protein